MLRSAAMTLLSKTLLTFLYKYLSDVDVEGVEMPSLYGSTEGPGSGWGVRLSNVKLREGAELYTLPGSKKPKPKEKPPKPKGETNNIPPEPPNDTTEDSRREENLKEKYDSDTEEATKEYPNRHHQNGYNTPERRNENGGRTNFKNGATASSAAGDAEDADGPMGRKRFESDYTYDDDSLSSLPEAGTPRPETPTQDSSISFLSCFAPGSEDAKKQAIAARRRLAEQQQKEQEANRTVETSQEEEGHGESSYDAEDPRVFKLNGHFRAVSDEEDLDDTIRRMAEEQVPVSADEHDLEDNDDDNEEDSEDDYDDSPPMILRIGEGGYIGTLDVRYGELLYFLEAGILPI